MNAKLRHLQQRAADAQALAESARAAADEARTALLAAGAKASRELRQELMRAEAAQHRRQDRAAAEMAVVNTCNHYLRSGKPIGAARPVAVPPEMTLDRARGEIKAARLEMERVAAAPPTRSEQVAGIRAAVQRLAERGRPVVRTDGGRIVVEMQQAEGWGDARPGPLHTLAWLDPETLVERLTAEIVDYPGAMSSPKRERLLAELGGKLGDLEAIEEALVMQAEADGRDVQRRVDCRPDIVLTTVLDETATAKAA